MRAGMYSLLRQGLLDRDSPHLSVAARNVPTLLHSLVGNLYQTWADGPLSRAVSTLPAYSADSIETF